MYHHPVPSYMLLQKGVYVFMYHMRILEGVLIIVVCYNSYAVVSYAMLHVQC